MCGSSRRYKPHARRTIQHTKPLTELRLLACIHDEDSVPSILNLLEVTNATTENPVCIYVLHLMELVGRAAPLLIAHKPNFMNKSGSRSSPTSNAIFGAFYNLQQHSNRAILVQPFISISPFSTMHDDICSLALQKKASLIIVPFHKRLSVAGSLDVVDYALQICNPNILTHAPCSVGILVDRGCLNGRFGGPTPGSALYRIGVLFFGGADDREALSYATRMVQHPSAVLTATRFVSKESSFEEMSSKEKHLDDELVSEFRRKSSGNRKIAYREMVVRDGEDTINAICSIEDVYDLIVVGRCQYWHSSELVKCLSLWSENPELGVIGDLCCSSDFVGGKASVLVMQQQTRAAASVFDVIDSKRV